MALPEPGARCAVLTRAADEPMAGTAPTAPRWVCLEDHGAWPNEITGHPDAAVAEFARRAPAAGFRLLLIRPHGRRSADTPARVFLADTSPGTSNVTALTVSSSSELAELPLPAPGRPLPGTPLVDPLLLICTHGRRDPCCAVDGRALAAALTDAEEPDVWECSHLGGHRFAPTALVLPTGYLYGRLDPAAATAARKAAAADEVEVDRCRGRSTWTPAGQVAELAVRAATGLRGAAALEVLPDIGDTVPVITHTGQRWMVDVERAEIGSLRPASCGAGLAPIIPIRAVRVRRVG